MQGPIISDDIFLEVEEARFERYQAGDALRLPISASGVRPSPHEEEDTIKGGVVAAIDDVMVMHKSIYDACNEILAEVHNLRHFSGDLIVRISNNSRFAERLLAQSVPLTPGCIRDLVLDRLRRTENMKRSVIHGTRSVDELVDSKGSVMEFERNFNSALHDAIDEMTDGILYRMLATEVDFFTNLYL
jgi:hypothetical protein